MKRFLIYALAFIVGGGIAHTAIHAVHAQTPPPTYTALTPEQQATISKLYSEFSANNEKMKAATAAPGTAAAAVVATPPAPFTVSLQNVANGLLSLASLFLTVALPFLLKMYAQHTKSANAANIATQIASWSATINVPIDRYGALIAEKVKSGELPTDLRPGQGMFGDIVKTVLKGYSDSAKALGYTDDSMAAALVGAAAKHLNAAPVIVTNTQPTPMPTPVPTPQPTAGPAQSYVAPSAASLAIPPVGAPA